MVDFSSTTPPKSSPFLQLTPKQLKQIIIKNKIKKSQEMHTFIGTQTHACMQTQKIMRA